MLNRLEELYRRLLLRNALPRVVRLALQTLALTVREVVRDQIPVRAAMLSYWSLVALVPVAVLALAVLRPLGVGEDEVRSLVYSALLAGPVAGVGATLDLWLKDVNLAGLGVAGLLGVLLTGSRIFFSMEEAYNALWGVELRRSWLSRMLLFYASVTLAPLLIAYGFHLSSTIGAQIDVSAWSWALPVLTTSAAFTVGIRLLPDTRVHWRSALTGGLVSAALFELAKVGFGGYISALGGSSVSAIYGSLALFPVFLLWLNLLWLIVLLGVKVAYVRQWHDALLLAETRRLREDDDGRCQADVFFALECLRVVLRKFAAGHGPATEAEITEVVGSDPAFVQTALENLRLAGLLAPSEAGWLPSAPPGHLTIRKVILAYRNVIRPSASLTAELPELADGPVV